MASDLKHDFVTVVKATRPSNKVVTVQNAKPVKSAGPDCLLDEPLADGLVSGSSA